MSRMKKILDQLSFLIAEKPIVYFVTEDDDFLDELFVKCDEFGIWTLDNYVLKEVPLSTRKEVKSGLINGTVNVKESMGWKPFESWSDKSTADELTKNIYYYKNANAKLNPNDIRGMQAFYSSCSSYINHYKTIDRKKRSNAMLVMSGSSFVLPKGLDSFVEIIDVKYEDEEDIQERLFNRLFNPEIRADADLYRDIVRLSHELKGFNSSQIEYVISMIEKYFPNSRSMNPNVLKTRMESIKAEFKRNSNHLKEQMVAKNGILKFIEIDENKDYTLSGFEKMDEWLKRVSNLFMHPEMYPGARPPRGVLIAGIPGTGKSQMAKRMSSLMKIPLLQLDIGSVLGGIVGESEENFRRALKLVDSAAPCILFIDELDKAFPTGNSANTNEVTKHLFGKMLNWMQECKYPVFIYATANHINDLDSAFLRSGRFSGKYYTLLPMREQLCDMVLSKLQSIRQKEKLFKWKEQSAAEFIGKLLDKAATDSKFFTGADIDEWINQTAVSLYNDNPSGEIDGNTLNRTLERELDKLTPYGKTNFPEVVGYWLQWLFSQFNCCGNDILFSQNIFDLENGNPEKNEKGSAPTFFIKEPSFNNDYDRLLFIKIKETIDGKGYAQIKREYIDSSIKA